MAGQLRSVDDWTEEQKMMRRIALETIDLSNKEAWTKIQGLLREEGIGMWRLAPAVWTDRVRLIKARNQARLAKLARRDE